MLILRLILAAALGARAADTTVIKFATLAPEGSTWMKVMRDLNAELQKETGGKLKFKMYPGGVSGDEKDVVKKVRIGQLHAAGFTGVGLGEIAPEVRVLDAPWLFRDLREVDHVYKAFAGRLEAAVLKGGYVLLGWTELGPVHVLSKSPINGPEDMKRSKMWVWEGDPIAEAAYKSMGISPIPLSIVDVLSSLHSGMIDAVYGPPMGVIALQWFTRTKHIYSVPMAHSTGAVLLTKKLYDPLPPEQKNILLDLSRKHLRRLNELSRAENEEALRSLVKQGLILSQPPSPELLKLYEDLGRKARLSLAGKLYPAELLAQIEKSLAELRAGDGSRRDTSPSTPARSEGQSRAKNKRS